MSTKGIGIDIIEIDRLQKAIDRHKEHFLQKLFTERERKFCLAKNNSTLHFAGRFAAKEAIVKALGVGFGKEISWLDIEILPDSKGKPIVTFSPAIVKKFHITNVLISISHTNQVATAMAIYE